MNTIPKKALKKKSKYKIVDKIDKLIDGNKPVNPIVNRTNAVMNVKNEITIE